MNDDIKVGDTLRINLHYSQEKMAQMVADLRVLKVDPIYFHLQDNVRNQYRAPKNLTRIYPVDGNNQADTSRSVQFSSYKIIKDSTYDYTKR